MDVLVPGGKIHTVSLGTSPKALLIIHGGPDWDHTYLLSAAEKISPHRQVILFDIRGCGKSSKFSDGATYTVHSIIDDIRYILTAYKLKCCDVLGFSFGGVVATHLLEQSPELISKLILASTTCFTDYQSDLEALTEYSFRMTPEIQEVISDSFSKAPAFGEEPSRTMALKTLALDVYNLEKLTQIKSIIAGVTFSSEWIKAFRSGYVKTKSLDAVKLINEANVDVLILHGAKDFRFPVSVAIRLHQQLPKTKLSIIADVGHLAHLEKTQEWATKVIQFLDCPAKH